MESKLKRFKNNRSINLKSETRNGRNRFLPITNNLFLDTRDTALEDYVERPGRTRSVGLLQNLFESYIIN
jgi:hypothetical protein